MIKDGITVEKLNNNEFDTSKYNPISPLAAIRNAPDQNKIAIAIVNYITDQTDLDSSDDDNDMDLIETWRMFPRALVKSFTANSFFFTNLV